MFTFHHSVYPAGDAVEVYFPDTARWINGTVEDRRDHKTHGAQLKVIYEEDDSHCCHTMSSTDMRYPLIDFDDDVDGEGEGGGAENDSSDSDSSA